MGRPKLLLPLAGRPVIEHVLSRLAAVGVAETVVVVRSDDPDLRHVVERSDATAVVPSEAPDEMIVSIQHALRHLERAHWPTSSDAWLLALADQPTIQPGVIRRLADRWAESNREILIPTYGGRWGHPVLFGWSLVGEVFELPPDQGLNQLVRRHTSTVEEVPVATPEVLVDLDSPEDYSRLRGKVEGGESS